MGNVVGNVVGSVVGVEMCSSSLLDSYFQVRQYKVRATRENALMN